MLNTATGNGQASNVFHTAQQQSRNNLETLKVSYIVY